jgi:hypothetical protein
LHTSIAMSRARQCTHVDLRKSRSSSSMSLPSESLSSSSYVKHSITTMHAHHTHARARAPQHRRHDAASWPPASVRCSAVLLSTTHTNQRTQTLARTHTRRVPSPNVPRAPSHAPFHSRPSTAVRSTPCSPSSMPTWACAVPRRAIGAQARATRCPRPLFCWCVKCDWGDHTCTRPTRHTSLIATTSCARSVPTS